MRSLGLAFGPAVSMRRSSSACVTVMSLPCRSSTFWARARVRVGAGARAVALAPSLADPLRVVTPTLHGFSLTSSVVDIGFGWQRNPKAKKSL
jgi:hypothetical protein